MNPLRSFRRWQARRRLLKALEVLVDGEGGWIFYCLARAFEEAADVPKDMATIFLLLLRSAQAGLPVGMIHVGFAYRSGKGTPADATAAHAWWMTAALGGDPGAEVLVGDASDEETP